MAKRRDRSQWFVECSFPNPNTKESRKRRASMNEIISRAVGATPDEGVSQGGENFQLDVKCDDGEKRRLCLCSFEVAQTLWAKRNDWGMEIRIWNRANQNTLARDRTFLFQKPMRQILQHLREIKK
jgi:hypothetical protein